MLSTQDKIKLVQGFQEAPDVYFQTVLRCNNLWQGEIDILKAIAKHDKVVVSSGHALGKDYTGGRLPLWFLSSFYPARVIMTAPTNRQVENIMWAELTQAYNDAGGKGVFGGDLRTLKLEIEPDKHFCIAFTTKETKGQTGKFQGFHAPNVLIIVSEAQALDDNIFEQIEGISTAGNTKIILLGNPLQNTGFFAKAIKDPKFGYHHIRLDCEKNPNFLAQKEVVPGLASYKWVKDMERKYGRESAMFQARVQGLVPDLSINSVIPFHLIELAVNKPLIVDRSICRRVIINDPASFGDDENVIMCMEEGRILETKVTGKQRTTITANECMAMHTKYNADGYIIDTVGEGRGVADTLVDTLNQDNVMEYKGSHEAIDNNQYYNCRAESHFYALEQFEVGFCSIPDDRILMEELAEPHYTHKRGLRLIEDKEEIKERLHRSPNRADAYIMGLWAMRTLIKRVIKRESWKDNLNQSRSTVHRSPMAA